METQRGTNLHAECCARLREEASRLRDHADRLVDIAERRVDFRSHYAEPSLRGWLRKKLREQSFALAIICFELVAICIGILNWNKK